MAWFLIKSAFTILIVCIAAGFARTWQLEHSAAQAQFLKGNPPVPPPDGLYEGSVSIKTSWLGKKFDAASSSGTNLFAGAEVAVEKFPFVTSLGGAVRQPSLRVLRIDYDTPDNPLWLRPVLDEVVEIAPGYYLGKLNLRLFPGYPWTLAFFELKKSGN